MNASLRDLGRRVDAVPVPQLDVAALVAAGQSRIRRRRLAAVAAVTAAVLIVIGGALLAAPATRSHQPQPAHPDRKKHVDGVVHTRLLTYAVGGTIHWGDTTIDVSRQANSWGRSGKLVDYVDATDDGAVFVVGQPPLIGPGPGSPAGVQEGDIWGVGGGPVAVWFTDGSAPVRIGTTFGDGPRGFEIAPTAEGSILAWVDPGSKTRPGQIVVYDTARMSEVARFGNADAEPLAVYPGVVYWSPTGTGCGFPGGWGLAVCQGSGPVMRFDTTSGQQSRVSRPAYLADRRAQPGLLTESDSHGAGSLFVDLDRRGDRLVSGATVALTGQPLRLSLPADDPNPNGLTLTQWLDPDRIVLVRFVVDRPDSHHGNELVVCRLSTGSCRLAVRISDTNRFFTAPGQAGSHR